MARNGKFFFVYIDRLPSVSLSDVKEKMDLALDWYRIDEGVWVLYTNSDKDKLYGRLSPLVKEEGSVFICKLDISERQGWMNEGFWEWLRKNQTE